MKKFHHSFSNEMMIFKNVYDESAEIATHNKKFFLGILPKKLRKRIQCPEEKNISDQFGISRFS